MAVATESVHAAASNCQLPGTPFKLWVPRSSNRRPDPATKSLTVLETNTSSGCCESPNPGPNMHRNATELFADHLTLAGVNARANVNAELLDRIDDRPAAANRTRRTIKRRQEAVAGRVDFATAMPRKLLTNKRVMLSEKVFPCAVAEFDKPLGRADDVREKYGCEHAVKIGFNFSAPAGQERFNLTED